MRFRIALLVLLLIPAYLQAEERRKPNRSNDRAAGADFEAKRRWLLEKIIKPIRDPRLAKKYTDQLAGMKPDQVDALVRHYQRELIRARRRGSNVSPAEREAAIRRYRQQLANRGNRVGFAPVITWLPSGTTLNAGAVVSPDRRHVRMSLNPVFSSVPYFDTFNLQNGRTRRYYVDQPPPRTRPTARRAATPTRPTPSWYRRIRSR